MTLAAAGMALLAMVVESRIEGRPLTEVAAPCFKPGRKAAECSMQAGIMEGGDITVTDGTALFRVSHYSKVGSVFLFSTAITTVTDYTANATMLTFHEVGILQVDLFPFLQRRQLAPSAFAAGLFGYRLLHR